MAGRRRWCARSPWPSGAKWKGLISRIRCLWQVCIGQTCHAQPGICLPGAEQESGFRTAITGLPICKAQKRFLGALAETVPIITPKPPVTLPMGGIKEKREIQKGRGVGYNEEAYRLLVSFLECHRSDLRCVGSGCLCSQPGCNGTAGIPVIFRLSRRQIRNVRGVV